MLVIYSKIMLLKQRKKIIYKSSFNNIDHLWLKKYSLVGKNSKNPGDEGFKLKIEVIDTTRLAQHFSVFPNIFLSHMTAQQTVCIVKLTICSQGSSEIRDACWEISSVSSAAFMLLCLPGNS